jgi:dTDP-4-amino-4,6-dideoxygalactose transaminase
MSSFPMFVRQEKRNPTAYGVSRQGINLPSGHNLNEADIDRVCRGLVDVFSLAKRRAA